MDMGIVHVDHLRKFKQFFNRIKLSKYTESDLKDLKQELILMENFILGIPTQKKYKLNPAFIPKCRKISFANKLHGELTT